MLDSKIISVGRYKKFRESRIKEVQTRLRIGFLQSKSRARRSLKCACVKYNKCPLDDPILNVTARISGVSFKPAKRIDYLFCLQGHKLAGLWSFGLNHVMGHSHILYIALHGGLLSSLRTKH